MVSTHKKRRKESNRVRCYQKAHPLTPAQKAAAVLRRKALRVAQTAERKRHTAMKNSARRRFVGTSATTGERNRLRAAATRLVERLELAGTLPAGTTLDQFLDDIQNGLIDANGLPQLLIDDAARPRSRTKREALGPLFGFLLGDGLLAQYLMQFQIFDRMFRGGKDDEEDNDDDADNDDVTNDRNESPRNGDDDGSGGASGASAICV